MSNLNRVTMIGNIGTEPEYVEFESGAKLTKFTLAVNRYDKKEKKDVTDWFNIETFSKLGEYLKKGYKVAIDGRLVTNTYENKDGKFVKNYIIQAQIVENLTTKKDKEETKETSKVVKEISQEEDLIDDEEMPF